MFQTTNQKQSDVVNFTCLQVILSMSVFSHNSHTNFDINDTVVFCINPNPARFISRADCHDCLLHGMREVMESLTKASGLCIKASAKALFLERFTCLLLSSAECAALSH